MVVVYLVLAVLGAAGTWWFNLQPMDQPYLSGWFANPASSSAAVDVIVVALVVCVFVVAESRRLGLPRATWVLLPLTFAVAVAFTFPLFLALRELHLRRSGDTAVGTAPAGRERAAAPGQVTA